MREKVREKMREAEEDGEFKLTADWNCKFDKTYIFENEKKKKI